MISVFVVSCPCALGVAIPLADDMAASAMERLGVFVRTATLWPRLQRVRRVIFDKTGTLTLERPVLENPEAVSGLDDAAALALARMTRGSLHPVARSLLEALGTRGQKLLAEHGDGETREFPGLGVTLGSGGWDTGRSAKPAGRARRRTASPRKPPAANSGRTASCMAAFHFSESLRPGSGGHAAALGTQRALAAHPVRRSPGKGASTWPKRWTSRTRRRLADFPRRKKPPGCRRSTARTRSISGDGANDSLAFDAALVTGTPVVDRSLLESKADFYTLGSGLAFLPGLLAHRGRAGECRAGGLRFRPALQPHDRGVFHGRKNEPAARRHPDAAELDRLDSHRRDNFPQENRRTMVEFSAEAH